MTTTLSEIDQLLILIDVDDPMTRDQEFHSLLKFGGLAKEWPDFLDPEQREIVRRSENGLAAGKYVIEIYTDRFHDFLYRCLPAEDYRALIFKCTNIQPFEDDEDMEEVQFVYEMKTVGPRKANDKEVPEPEVKEDPEDTPEVSMASYFTAPKILH